MEIVQVGNLSYDVSEEIVELLLKDRNTNKNIIFATSNYARKGYRETDEIRIEYLKNRSRALIRARVDKSKEEQRIRSKEKAEVFTPSWVCNKQNNLIDDAWFGKEGVFNVERGEKWVPTEGKIAFPINGKTWQDYVNDVRLEITCGEAPYLTSRYDAASGFAISPRERIGLLDRKLRVVGENCDGEEEWAKWAESAYKAVYGYEFQGDSLLIARENLLFTFIDCHKDKFGIAPSDALLREIANIISFNIFQMDGLKYVVPFSCKNTKGERYVMTNVFGEEVFVGKPERKCPGCEKNNVYLHNGKYCLVMDWQKGKKVKFTDLLGKGI